MRSLSPCLNASNNEQNGEPSRNRSRIHSSPVIAIRSCSTTVPSMYIVDRDPLTEESLWDDGDELTATRIRVE
jgi:hypothetical protein